jgi:phosphotransacetylase
VQIKGALPATGDLRLHLVVIERRMAERVVVLAATCTDAAGQVVASAGLEVLAPVSRQSCEIADNRLDGLLERCQPLAPMRTGVVHPCSADALAGAVAAGAAGLIVPVLYGPVAVLHRIAAQAKLDLSGCEIVAADTPEDAAQAAASAAGAGDLAALMKGSLHTGQFLHAILRAESRLRVARTLSHCALMSVPTYARRVIVTDVALNIAPDTDQKRDICQNAIGFARAMGVAVPKVAVLAAVEMVETRMQATLDGAILAKMADRGQIVGGIVDGPLDLDAAVDAEAARVKGITSPVAGAADVLLVPTIEAGNMVYKNLSFMSDAQMAGVVVGAKVPVILSSRADTVSARLFSAAAAVLYAAALAADPTILAPELAG